MGCNRKGLVSNYLSIYVFTHLSRIFYHESASVKVGSIHFEDSIICSLFILKPDKGEIPLLPYTMSPLITLYLERNVHISNTSKLLEGLFDGLRKKKKKKTYIKFAADD